MSPLKSISRVKRNAPPHWVGDGFPVRTLFSFMEDGAAVSPFLLLDYGGPVDFPPAERPRGVDEHPHRGFETVTIVYQGELEHRDSGGNAGKIGPGDVQWMTAASGVVHEEKHGTEFTRRGGTLEMAQLWVNLPARHKMDPPRYQTILAASIPVVEPAAGVRVRVIAGALGASAGPARTVTPMDVWDLELAGGATASLPVPAGHGAIVIVRSGKITVQGTERLAHTGVAILGRDGDTIALEAHENAAALILTGEPIDEPVVGAGPFVMNTREEILQAIGDYRSGRMGTLG